MPPTVRLRSRRQTTGPQRSTRLLKRPGERPRVAKPQPSEQGLPPRRKRVAKRKKTRRARRKKRRDGEKRRRGGATLRRRWGKTGRDEARDRWRGGKG